MSTILFILAWALVVAGLASAKIELLEERKGGYAADVNFLRQTGTKDRHFTQEEVSDLLSKQVCVQYACEFD